MIELTTWQLIGIIFVSMSAGIAFVGAGVLLAISATNAVLDEIIEKKKAMKSEEK